MLIEKIVETILEKLSISKVFLVFTIVFILATLIAVSYTHLTLPTSDIV